MNPVTAPSTTNKQPILNSYRKILRRWSVGLMYLFNKLISLNWKSSSIYVAVNLLSIQIPVVVGTINQMWMSVITDNMTALLWKPDITTTIMYSSNMQSKFIPHHTNRYALQHPNNYHMISSHDAAFAILISLHQLSGEQSQLAINPTTNTNPYWKHPPLPVKDRAKEFAQ